MNSPAQPPGALAPAPGADEIVETIREPLLVLDARLRVLRANRAFYATFRVAPDETEGRPLHELGDGQWNVPALRARLEGLLAGEPPLEDFEVEHDFPRIGRRIMLLNARRIARAPGAEPHLLVALEDVTARRETERALESYRARLEEANRRLESANAELARSNAELEQFAYVASHDLQEPLRMVASYTQLLERRYKDLLDADGREFIAFAVDGATRMKALINDLLAYSRAGAARPAPSPVRLDEALDRALANLGRALEEAQADVSRDPLPEVRGDLTQLTQLFQNLVANAAKFRRGPGVRIRVSAARRGPEWVIAVTDDGIGIDPAFFGRLFILFQRLHGKTEYPGTGIGLALCRKIVERHGGRIWVESSPGAGSTFSFTLPVPGDAP